MRLVRAFTIGGSKAQDVAKQIKEALGQNKGSIKINEVKFVAADPATGEISVAAQIAAQTLGPEFKEWLNDPQKLLQLIAAAEGSKSGGSQLNQERFQSVWCRAYIPISGAVRVQVVVPVQVAVRVQAVARGRGRYGNWRQWNGRSRIAVGRQEHRSSPGRGSHPCDPSTDAFRKSRANGRFQPAGVPAGTGQGAQQTRG